MPSASLQRRSPPRILILTALAAVVLLIAAVAWLASLLLGGDAWGVVVTETITVRAPVRGRLDSFRVAVGDRVRTGDVLAVLTLPDPQGEQAALRDKRATDMALLARLDAGSASGPSGTGRELRLDAARAAVKQAEESAATRSAALAALEAEARIAAADATAREETRARMELLVRLDAAIPEDVATTTREAQLARARSDAVVARLAALKAEDPAAQLASAKAEVQRLETAPAESLPAPDRQAVVARLAVTDTALARFAPRTITASAAGIVQELAQRGDELAAEVPVAVLATDRFRVDIHVPLDRGSRAMQARTARIRGVLMDLPLRPGAWRQQAPSPFVQALMPQVALVQRLDLPTGTLVRRDQVVEVTLR